MEIDFEKDLQTLAKSSVMAGPSARHYPSASKK